MLNSSLRPALHLCGGELVQQRLGESALSSVPHVGDSGVRIPGTVDTVPIQAGSCQHSREHVRLPALDHAAGLRALHHRVDDVTPAFVLL